MSLHSTLLECKWFGWVFFLPPPVCYAELVNLEAEPEGGRYLVPELALGPCWVIMPRSDTLLEQSIFHKPTRGICSLRLPWHMVREHLLYLPLRSSCVPLPLVAFPLPGDYGINCTLGTGRLMMG